MCNFCVHITQIVLFEKVDRREELFEKKSSPTLFEKMDQRKKKFSVVYRKLTISSIPCSERGIWLASKYIISSEAKEMWCIDNNHTDRSTTTITRTDLRLLERTDLRLPSHGPIYNYWRGPIYDYWRGPIYDYWRGPIYNYWRGQLRFTL